MYWSIYVLICMYCFFYMTSRCFFLARWVSGIDWRSPRLLQSFLKKKNNGWQQPSHTAAGWGLPHLEPHPLSWGQGDTTAVARCLRFTEIMVGWKTYEYYYETDELPTTQGQPNPRKIRLYIKSGIWGGGGIFFFPMWANNFSFGFFRSIFI